MSSFLIQMKEMGSFGYHGYCIYHHVSSGILSHDKVPLFLGVVVSNVNVCVRPNFTSPIFIIVQYEYAQ